MSLFRVPLVTRTYRRTVQQPQELPNLVVRLGTDKALQGAATAGADASGALSVGKPLAGEAVASGIADAGLGLGKPLTGDAAAGGQASGALDTVSSLPFRLLDQPNPIAVRQRHQPTMHRPAPDAGTSTNQQLEGAAIAGATAAAALTDSGPFSQREWWTPSRTSELHPSQDWINVLFRPAPPFTQSNWPNPARRLTRQQTDRLGGVIRATTQVALQGAAIAGGTASGAVSVGVSLVGSAVTVSEATGDLALSVTLSGAALASAAASAALLGLVAMEGSATAGATADASLSIDVRLTGDAIAGGSAASNLTLTLPLTGAALTSAVAAGELTVRVLLSGSALAGGQASGALSHGVSLAGDAVAGATAWAAFPDESMFSVDAYTVTARARVMSLRGSRRKYIVRAAARTLRVEA